MTLAYTNPLLTRVATIVSLAALLLAPLMLISSKIAERRENSADVIRELAATAVGAQQLAGPLLFQPCTEHYVDDVTDAFGKVAREARTRNCSRTIIADGLSIDAVLTVENRHRGIYTARFYGASLEIKGVFDAPQAVDITRAGETREWGQPVLVFFVADVRGIGNRVTLRWDGQDVAFEPGSGTTVPTGGLHANVEAAGIRLLGKRTFSFHLNLAGQDRLAFVPSAGDMLVALKAPWPHPRFYGHHLPEKRAVDNNAFDAVWHVTSLASDAPEALVACAHLKCPTLDDKAFGVALIDPVDVYVESSRAVSYGFLFVGLTFAMFFVAEVLGKFAVHPAQYTLVGLALTIFFLLLFALAEHIDFALAYAIAASACTGVLGFYTVHVLGSRLRGLGFSAAIALLYGALYLLLRSEDYALLLGSCLVFAALASFMALTRKLDWSQVARRLAQRKAPAVHES